ncbi:hypothetical protein CK203_069108 [Vitis vinifera]|uniref:Uncharacterized protein n=1 Tax=Vitis vinifera TaxID=29760 RepID=A0A438F161_VITVI|nr:hypothetical protein CK203_069108 [Vitis vinifera]
MGGEDYITWHEKMERCQREAYFPKNTKFFSDSYMTRSEEGLSSACQTQLDEDTNSTQASMKRRHDRRGFIMPKFTMYDGTNDLFDHIMHFRQLITLDIGNDALLCKENESLKDFMKQFGQTVLQVESCMDTILQIFDQSIGSSTPFFESLTKKSPTMMDDLFRFDMRRILFDLGSSVDLLQMSAFKHIDGELPHEGGTSRSSWQPASCTPMLLGGPDEEKTTIVTPHRLYYYKVMLFRLKNSGVSYQRLMTKIFKPLISRTVKVYIVVKSETRVEHVQHLEEIFCLMRAYNMKLNPAKCTYGVSVGKFLGCLAALGCFIACFTNKLRHFFLTLRGASTFGWTDQFELPKKQAHLADRPGEQWWTLHVDRTSRVFRSRIGLILQSPTGEPMEKAIHLNFSATNNEVEYEVVLVGLDLALVLVATKLEIRNDSQLIFGQIQQEYEAKDERMTRFLTMVESRLEKQNEGGTRRREASAQNPYTISMLHLINDQLYRQSFGGPYLKCLNEPVTKYVLVELHEGQMGGGREAMSASKTKMSPKLNIKNPYSTSHYPQSNGLADMTNKTVLSAPNKILEEPKGKWVDELPRVLWAYWTKSRWLTRATPFVLAYEMEVIIPTKIEMPIAKTAKQDQMDNDEELRRQLDWVDELQEDVTIQIASYHQRTIP